MPTLKEIVSYGDLMYHQKPARERGQDLRTLPTYTIPEAASFLAIDPWTLLDWYSKRSPVLTPSARYGPAESFALLSFRDIEEAYKVHLLRTKFGYSMQYVRKAMVDARKESGSDHPLLDQEIIAFDCLALALPHGMIALGAQRSLYIAEVVRTWGKRIIADKKGRTRQIFPWRYAKEDEVSRPVSIEPDVMSGRLVVTGTRIPVSVLKARSLAGMSVDDLAKDYDINRDLVEKALVHFEQKTS